MSPAIEINQLTKTFGSVAALRGVDLVVEPGTVYGLIGPNGAGKTTTMRILLDLMRPSSGTVRVLDEDPRAGGPALRRRIGYLPGELVLSGRASGHRLLDYYASISGTRSTTFGRQLADRLGVDLSRPAGKLSKGNKQKLGVVQAFMHRPDLLILDEPTSGLDPLVQQTVLEMVAEARDSGQTVLLSSHILSEIQQAADRVAILRHGEIIVESDVERLRATARRRVVALVRRDSAPSVVQLAPLLGDLSTRDDGDTTRISGDLTGDIDVFVKLIGRSAVLDLQIEEPDLESTVLGLYDDEEAVK